MPLSANSSFNDSPRWRKQIEISPRLSFRNAYLMELVNASLMISAMGIAIDAPRVIL